MTVKGCSVVVKAQGRWKQRGGWLDGEVELRTLEVDTFLGEGKIEGLVICVDSRAAGMFSGFKVVSESLLQNEGGQVLRMQV